MNYLTKLCIAGSIFYIGQSTELQAQKKQQMPIELELETLHEKAVSFHYQNLDSLIHYDELFNQTLIDYITNNSNSFKESFHFLQEKSLLNIVTSDDKKLKIYSWESADNGTMRFNNVLFQYKVGKEIKTQMLKKEDPTDPLYYFTSLNTLNNKGFTYYIAKSKTIVSKHDLAESIHVLTIGDSVVKTNHELFKTTKKNYSRIDVNYDIFSIYNESQIGYLIQYNAKDKIVKIPVVTPEGVVTPRFIIYKFDGNHFIHTKIEEVTSK